MRLVDTEVAAVALGVSVRRIQQLVADGLLTNYGTPRKIRVSLDDLTRFA